MDINFSQRDIFLYFVIKVFMVYSEFKIVHNEMIFTINKKFKKYEIAWNILYIYERS